MIKITEKQIVDAIISSKDLELLSYIPQSDFKNCKEYIDFITDYHEHYKTVPSETVMQTKFTEYKCTPVEGDVKFLVDNYNNSKYQNEFIDILQKAADMSEQDSFKAKEYLEQMLAKGSRQAINEDLGVDIVATARERYEQYTAMKTPEEKSKIISFGLPQLDKVLLGIEKQDYITIVARPNIGKSWVAEYFGVQAWKQGKKVLYYSGEMDVESMGYRFDTWNANFSNFGIRSGGDDLGLGKTANHYKSYTEALSQKAGFIVLTPQDFNGRRPTIRDIDRCAKIHKPDLIILDQMSLLADYRRANNIREQYNNISTDILTYVNTTEIPVILVAQANRGADQGSKAKDGVAPELNEIMESDKLGQDSKKVFSLAMKDGILSIVVKKGRNGGKDTEVKMNWDIDKGIFKPLLDNQTAEEASEDYGF